MIESGPPIVTAVLTTVAFAENHVIEASVTGNGVYEFSLDDGAWQESNIFENVSGYNDTWNIYGIQTQANSKIYIFDRYGKLVKQLSPTGEGWNGTFNGTLLPTSDYWFTVEYDEPISGERKTFRAHFTLKR